MLVFACSERVAFAAADARPYPLALLLLIASTWMLVRWLESGRRLYAAGYVWPLGTGKEHLGTQRGSDGWASLPLGTLYLFSVFTRNDLFLPCYYVSAAPGLALLFGWGIRAAAAIPARPIAAAILVISMSLSFRSPQQGDADWAGARAKVRAHTATVDTSVLVVRGLLEVTNPDTLSNPSLREVLFAPLALYPAAGKIVGLAVRLDERSLPCLEAIVQTDLQHCARFVLVCEWPQKLTYQVWLRGWLASELPIREPGKLWCRRRFSFQPGRPRRSVMPPDAALRPLRIRRALPLSRSVRCGLWILSPPC
jgi:hypothetical protein